MKIVDANEFFRAHLKRDDLELQIVVTAAAHFGDIAASFGAMNAAHRSLKSLIDRGKLKAARLRNGEAWLMTLVSLDDLSVLKPPRSLLWLRRFVKRWKSEH